MRNGIPFDVAFTLDPITRQGFGIIFSEFDGAKFNRKTMEYEKKE